MASSSSTGASTSTALRPNNPYCYDVFINHRGPDVKKTFASYLYRWLLSHGLRVFLDQQELQQGEDLTPQIHGAINTASVHIAIFSPTYPQSNWCLNELLLMLETLERGATIIPVFYNVKPSDLRWNRGGQGLYVSGLHDLEKKKTDEGKLRYDSATVENWRNALSRLADKSGFELASYNGDEGELLDKVVERVLKKVKRPGLDVAKHPTGLDDKIQDFENTVLLRQQHRGKPLILGIVGLGGMGKTTLAKEFFNRKDPDYPRSCFLSDVRDAATKGTLHLLQRKLMKSLTGSDNQIDSVDEGTVILRNHLSSSKALLILDDVDHVTQVDAFFAVHTGLCSDSLILITSRNRDVLIGSGVEESSIYNLTGLDGEHSRELFCLHSFNQAHPLPGFESLVDKFVEACGGLPLSLIVFGALVYEKNETYWEAQLDKLQKTLPAQIKRRLQISYNALDEEEQHMFLDIACFFVGKNKDTAIRIWDGSGWSGWLGFYNIQNRCLVKVDSKNRIHMHDHIRDLGRHIAKAPGLPLRLWRGEENILQLSSVKTEVRGIRMVGDYHDQYASFSCCKNCNHDLLGNCVWMRCNRQDHFHGIYTTKLQLLDVKDGLTEPLLGRVKFPNLVWLRWEKCPYTSLPSWIPMKNLRVLQVVGGKLELLWQRKSQAPMQLRELEISSPISNIPKSIKHLTHLERIVVENGRKIRLPEEFCLLQSLKVLVLHFCLDMKTLPDNFGNLTNLQHIELHHCENLKRLPNSFRNLIRLKYLSVMRCKSLTISSDTLGHISTLQYIDFSGCEKIKVLPPQVARQGSLEELHLRDTELKELHSSIGELSNLEVLTIGSHSLDKLPPSLGDLSSLKSLELLNCTELKCLPRSVRRLTQLTRLAVVNCPLTELPFETVEGERGRLLSSSNLDSPIEQFMPRLQELFMWNTEILELSFSAGVCPNLQDLDMYDCSYVVEVGTLPNTLLKLYLNDLPNLRKIEGLCGLTKLQRLQIRWCEQLEELPCIETLISLEELNASGCTKLKTIRGLGCLTKLRVLDVDGCSGLEELPDIEHLRSLVKLEVYECPKLQFNDGVVEQLQQQLKEIFAEATSTSNGESTATGNGEEWPSDDSEDDDYDPEKQENINETGNENNMSDYGKSIGWSESSNETDNESDASLTDNLNGYISKGRKRSRDTDEKNGQEPIIYLDSDENDGSDMPVLGRRQRRDVDYKKLHDKVEIPISKPSSI